MAAINGTIRSKLGPDNRPIYVPLPDGSGLWWVTLTIPAGQTYDPTATGRIRFDHGGDGSCQKMLGTRIIKQIICSNGFSASGVSTGEGKGIWSASAQTLSLFRTGTAAPGTGPQDEAEFGAVSLGSGTISCEAMVMV